MGGKKENEEYIKIWWNKTSSYNLKLGKKGYHWDMQDWEEAPLKRRTPSTRQHDVKTQKAAILMLIALITWNLTHVNSLQDNTQRWQVTNAACLIVFLNKLMLIYN
jgi:hypothetical protein